MSLLLLLLVACQLYGGTTATVQFGRYNYTEYQAGNLSLILTVPHGGSLKPSAIPDRAAGCWDPTASVCLFQHTCPPGLAADPNRCDVSTSKDLYTLEVAMKLREHLKTLTGFHPHVVINNLHRIKLDANRDRDEASFGNSFAEQAWDDFMNFIERAKGSIGVGLIVDLHGQVHTEGWVEVGYTISGKSLDASTFGPDDSSIRHLAGKVQASHDVTFDLLLRGAQSLGGTIEREGDGAYSAVPSPTHPGPNGGGYFSGGYITQTHGSRYGGTVDALQVEMPKAVRSSEGCEAFCPVLARAIAEFWRLHYCAVGSVPQPHGCA